MGPGGVMPEGMTSGMGPPPFETSPPSNDNNSEDINNLD
jgi:hypothetical protein